MKKYIILFCIVIPSILFGQDVDKSEMTSNKIVNSPVSSSNKVIEKTKVYKRESVSPKIGKTGDHRNPATKTLSVYIPLNAEIKNIKAYFSYCPWGKGESDYKPTSFTETAIINYNGQSYKEWGSGWARAYFIEQQSNKDSQWVTVRFESWKHDNSRKAKLEVEYFYP